MTIKQKIVGKSLGTALLVASVGLLSAASMFRIGNTLRTSVVTELRESDDVDQLRGAAVRIDRTIDEYCAARQSHQQTDAVRLGAEVDATPHSRSMPVHGCGLIDCVPPRQKGQTCAH